MTKYQSHYLLCKRKWKIRGCKTGRKNASSKDGINGPAELEMIIKECVSNLDKCSKTSFRVVLSRILPTKKPDELG